MPERPARAPRLGTRATRNSKGGRESAGAREVSASLQRYADRGVFRGLSTSAGKGGRLEFRFLWLTRTPMHVTYDPRTSVLRFARLMPNAAGVPSLVAGVKRVVDEHLGPTVPEHRRVNKRRALVRCTVQH